MTGRTFTQTSFDPDQYRADDGTTIHRERYEGPRGGKRVRWNLYVIVEGRMRLIGTRPTLRDILQLARDEVPT